MYATVLDEPELEFGAGGRHIDPRFGIATYGPVDAGTDSAPSRIRIGIVAPQAAVEGIRSWLHRAREPINAKPPKYPGQATLFPSFPGFDRVGARPRRAQHALDSEYSDRGPSDDGPGICHEGRRRGIHGRDPMAVRSEPVRRHHLCSSPGTRCHCGQLAVGAGASGPAPAYPTGLS
jgi:hypothetical protein